MKNPLVTIGIVSCNRFYYLKALVGSAYECILYGNLEWIIVDNASIEPGLREYLEQLDFVQHKIFRPERSPSTEHVKAMNKIIESSNAEYVMILPEDIQFIVRGEWMKDFVELVETHKHIGTVVFDAQRRVTVNKYFASKRSIFPFRRSRPFSLYMTSSGREFLGYGNSKPGISGAGIMTFGRKEIWQRLGPWRATGRQTVADSSGGGETDMLHRYERSGLKLERCLVRIPIAADIITDPIGTKARIRGNRHYGKYFAPPSGKFYYRIWDESELHRFGDIQPAAAFEDIVEPIGFDLPYDNQGNLLKNPHRSEDAEFEWIHPSVAGVDIR